MRAGTFRFHVLRFALCSSGLSTSALAQGVIADLRTGVASDGSFIAGGGSDDDYVLTDGPFLQGPYPRPATVAGSSVDPNALYVSQRSDEFALTGHYFYEVHFAVPAGAVNPRLGGRVLPIDAAGVRLNGVVLDQHDSWIEADGWSYFVAGDNILSFEVTHSSNKSALAVDAWVTDATTIAVPADFPSIQAAIDAALDGDTILVAPGTYTENLDFHGKGIVLTSTDGPASTVIDGGGVESVVKFLGGEPWTTRLEGFTIRNGYGYVGYCGCTHLGGGIVISEQLATKFPSNPTISRCVITGNVAEYGGGIYSSFSRPAIEDCVIASNTATADGGGLNFVNGLIGGNPPALVNCTIVGNSAGTGAAGAGLLDGGAGTTVANCIIRDNSPTEASVASPGYVEFSDVKGGISGTGNIDADPLFANSASGDFHLLDGSPCADAGSMAARQFNGTDIDGDARPIGNEADIGADEHRIAPKVLAVAPARERYDHSTSVTVTGSDFSRGGSLSVLFGNASGTNVLVLDDATLTCDVPTSEPGPVDVSVSNANGTGVLAAGFVFTPAITIEGDTTIGSSITIHDLCDPGDGIFAVYGLPPAVSIPTPPFDGDLAIVPFHYFFYVTAWPFDSFDVPATIPNDPALVGVDVLLQSLIGPQLTKPPKDGSWTNCAVLSIH